MNKYVVGGFLAFAVGVGGLTQAFLEAFPKPLAKHANDIMSGKVSAEKIEQATAVNPTAQVGKNSSNNYGLATYQEPASAPK
ncbi:MAG: hypothetical protein A3J37_04700 [Alphaproteobacteria bacterium RIFCSPHIGHO2_12_FULL_45_9]|nr:MAG: hypothetical protein A3B66_07690 [Alphaproteobacteria bacterium RIFCSPHIGHO2_02_FULL_46_13]OFW98194.1 MAG: hypothetical protein A3J37_04700 [Alphaproteobacteria bacterium RIFCSPHIGHO2_12_FULL_45_9]